MPKPNRLPVRRACAMLPLLLAGAGAGAQQAADGVAEVVIFGQGQTRQVQNITKADLAKALPGTSPLKILEKLPGVSFQSADAFGAYEWSTRFSVRGFSQGQLGFTLDNVPLGNMSYGNNNGLHISRAISAENLAQVDLSQGAGAVGTASSGNLGGTVQFLSGDPQERAALAAAQTIGSHRMRRSYLRLDSGRLASGASAYLSLTRQRAMKWKGDGPQDQDLVNTKLVQAFGEHRWSAFFNYSNRSENDYQDMSLDMLGRLGWNWDNYAPDWQRALEAARGQFRGAVNNLDDAYYDARGLRRDHLAGSTLELAASAALTLKATVYHHDNDGQGHWYTPYTPSSAAVPISIRTTEYAIRRHGAIADLAWEAGKHTVNGGAWFEHNLHTLTRNYYAVDGPQDSNHFLRNPFLTGFRQQFTTRTAQFYLQDTWLLAGDQLKLNAGFKSPHVTIDATSINAARAAGRLRSASNFLPQLGLNYDLNRADEVFASLTRNQRAFEPGVYGQFSQSQAAFDASGARLQPETSLTMDLGWRWRRPSLTGSVALYRADFDNRIVSVATCAGVVGCANTVVNVGRVATRGLEAAMVWTPLRHWSWFNTFTDNHSRYRDDYRDGLALVPVSGKQVVDAPRRMFSSELGFDNKAWFARLEGKFTGRRYYTYVNDGAVDAYWLMNLAAGVKRAQWAGLRELSAELHLGNLLNKRYFGTLGSNQFVASDPHGQFATLLTGAPRELFFTLSAKL